MDHIPDNAELEAEIYYLKTEEGGRQTTFGTGYRGQFYYDGKNWDATQHFIGQNTCDPGETVTVLMRIATPDDHKGKLFVNKSFEIREGARVVGVGRITKIFFEEFKKTEMSIYEKCVCDLLLADDEFAIKSVHDLDTVKSFSFDEQWYLTILPLIKSGKWYMIEDHGHQAKEKSFNEYLYIETFSDPGGKKYVATIYDNDELTQYPQIIHIFQI